MSEKFLMTYPNCHAFSTLVEVARLALEAYEQGILTKKSTKIHCSIRKRKTENEDDNEDKDWRSTTSNFKKMKRSTKSFVNKTITHLLPPDLSQKFKNRVAVLGGSNFQFVIQKTLYDTDVSENHNRLSMPLLQIKAEFLTDEEKKELDNQKTKMATLIEPSLKKSTICLRQWNMKKTNGNVNAMYVLRTGWKNVVSDNDLKANDVIQVWSFRVRNDEELGLVLVVVERGVEAGN